MARTCRCAGGIELTPIRLKLNGARRVRGEVHAGEPDRVANVEGAAHHRQARHLECGDERQEVEQDGPAHLEQGREDDGVGVVLRDGAVACHSITANKGRAMIHAS